MALAAPMKSPAAAVARKTSWMSAARCRLGRMAVVAVKLSVASASPTAATAWATVISPLLTASAACTRATSRAAAVGLATLIRCPLINWDSMGAEMPRSLAICAWFRPNAAEHRCSTSFKGAPYNSLCLARTWATSDMDPS